MKKVLGVLLASLLASCTVSAMAADNNESSASAKALFRPWSSETTTVEHLPSKAITSLTIVHRDGSIETISTADALLIDENGVPLGGDSEVIQYLQSILDTEGDPAKIYQYNPNTTENTAAMISENAEGTSGWECSDILVLTGVEAEGDLKVTTVVPYSDDSKVKVIIGNFMGPGGVTIYEPGEIGWATPDDENNNDEIKWVDAPTTIDSDGALSISLDNKVEPSATSVIAMIFNNGK